MGSAADYDEEIRRIGCVQMDVCGQRKGSRQQKCAHLPAGLIFYQLGLSVSVCLACLGGLVSRKCKVFTRRYLAGRADKIYIWQPLSHVCLVDGTTGNRYASVLRSCEHIYILLRWGTSGGMVRHESACLSFSQQRDGFIGFSHLIHICR